MVRQVCQNQRSTLLDPARHCNLQLRLQLLVYVLSLARTMHEFEPRPQSYLQWYFNSMGMPTLLVIVGLTLLAMVLAVILFWRGRGPAVPAAILLVSWLPLIAGAVCFLSGVIMYLSELAGPEPSTHATISYALTASMQATSCFCPLLMLSLVLLMVLGFRTSGTRE
jgi:hypothetical protein